jgi:hypothetical protein
LATLLEPDTEIWRIFNIYGYGKSQKYLILALLIFNIAFWLYKAGTL